MILPGKITMFHVAIKAGRHISVNRRDFLTAYITLDVFAQQLVILCYLNVSVIKKLVKGTHL